MHTSPFPSVPGLQPWTSMISACCSSPCAGSSSVAHAVRPLANNMIQIAFIVVFLFAIPPGRGEASIRSPV
jgi:hypothetical protein